LRDKIEGRRPRPGVASDGTDPESSVAAAPASDPRQAVGWTEPKPSPTVTDDSLMDAKQGLADAVETLVALLRRPELRGAIPITDRANLAKYLTIAKLKLENAIAIVRSDNPDA
jgi:hypothetical protein